MGTSLFAFSSIDDLKDLMYGLTSCRQSCRFVSISMYKSEMWFLRFFAPCTVSQKYSWANFGVSFSSVKSGPM